MIWNYPSSNIHFTASSIDIIQINGNWIKYKVIQNVLLSFHFILSLYLIFFIWLKTEQFTPDFLEFNSKNTNYTEREDNSDHRNNVKFRFLTIYNNIMEFLVDMMTKLHYQAFVYIHLIVLREIFLLFYWIWNNLKVNI